jgi:hypothetical protein
MKTKRCLACQNLGRNTQGKCRDEIYNGRGEMVVIDLCYCHSVELFKLGQTTFAAKYEMESITRDTHRPNSMGGYFAFN